MILHEHQLIASICRESYFDFVKEFWGEIIHETPVFNWHIKVLCDEVQALAERVFKGATKDYDLLINVPPGSTKSTICSQMLAPWIWTRMPHCQLLHISYAEDIAIKDAIRSRDLINSDLYRKCFPEIIIREDVNAKGKFQNIYGGWRMARGMDGQITGEHAHIIGVDDPIDPKKATSEAELRGVLHVMNEVIPSRKVNKLVTPTILIQQRVNQADPSGEWLERGTNVRHICLPGELTDDVTPKELRRFYKDGLLDPVRLPKKVLDNLRQFELGEYGYAAQILQSPVPLGGGMFRVDKFNQVEGEPNKWLRLIRSWDKAGTKDGGAWSVGVLMGMDMQGNYWILDVVRGQWAATEREKKIDETAAEDGPSVEIIVEIEGGSGGKESAEGTIARLTKMGYTVFAYHPTGDKESRAYNYASQVGYGNVFILIRHWTKAFLEEHRFFPHSKYKDQVDATSGGFNRLHRPPVQIGGMRLMATHGR